MWFARLLAMTLAGVAISQIPVGRAAAQPATAPFSATLVWSSNGKNVQEVASELSSLYLGLFNTNRLTVTIEKTMEATPIENILRSNSIIVGSVFPIEMESVICDLNTHLCSRERTPAPSAASANPRAVRGFLPSRGSWNLKNGATLVLPAIHLERSTRWISTKKSISQPMDTLVTKILGGCDIFDERCRTNILS